MLKQFSDFCIEHKAEKTAERNYQICLATSSQPFSRPKFMYINEDDINTFYDLWFDMTSETIESGDGTYCFINNVIKRANSNSFKFFIDLDFKDLEFTSDNTILVFKIISEIQAKIKELYNIQTVNCIIWGRDLKFEKYRFHIHFPDIIINDIIVKAVIILLQEHLDTVFFDKRDVVKNILDIAPYTNGLRIGGSFKISNVGEKQYETDKESYYILYRISRDSKISKFDFIPKYKSQIVGALVLSELSILDDSVIVSPCNVALDFSKDIEDDIILNKYYDTTISGIKNLSEDEIITRCEEEIFRRYGFKVSYRTTKGEKMLVFDTEGQHPCPVNPENTHGRENIFCTIKRTGVFVHCFNKGCGRPVCLFKLNVPETFDDANYDQTTAINLFYSENGREKAINYINKFYCVVNEKACVYFKHKYNFDDPNTIKASEMTDKPSVATILETTVKVDDKRTTTLFKLWNSSENRTLYNGLIFTTDNEQALREKKLNLFKGFKLSDEILREHYERARMTDKYDSDVAKFQYHILNWWCKEDEELLAYVLNFFAFCFQRPLDLIESAIGLVGGQGTGKSTLMEKLFAYFEEHFYLVTDTESLTKFRLRLQDKLVVFWDEAMLTTNGIINALKSMITQRKISASEKYVKEMSFDNRIKLVFSTNDWIDSGKKIDVDIENDSRRFIFLKTQDYISKMNPDKDIEQIKQIKRKYFDELYDNIDYKNLWAYLSYEVDISDFNPRIIPETQTLAKAKLESGIKKDIILRFVYEDIISDNPLLPKNEFSIDEVSDMIRTTIYGPTSKMPMGTSSILKSIKNNLSHATKVEQKRTRNPYTDEEKVITYIKFKSSDKIKKVFGTLFSTNVNFLFD